MPSGDTEVGKLELPNSRALLFPGPVPPLSHFGVTLLRHVVVSGLRYTFYQLGVTPTDRSPVRFVALRLYLDGNGLQDVAASERPSRGGWADEVAAALALPGGTTAVPRAGTEGRGAILFHRGRLRLPFASRRAPRAPVLADRSPAALWELFSRQLQAELPHLRETLLGEALAAIDRRRRRTRGQDLTQCLGPQAARFIGNRRPELTHLGTPDPLVGSWRLHAERVEGLRQRTATDPSLPTWRFRGRFREAYRAALDRLRGPYLELARAAADRGVVDRPEDAFFIPFDLGHELMSETAPGWLAPAIDANRREYDANLDAPPPPDLVSGGTVALGGRIANDRPSFDLAPLTPLD